VSALVTNSNFVREFLEYVVSYYGALKTGAVVAPLNTDLKPDGLRTILWELEPRVVISSSRFEKLLKPQTLANRSPEPGPEKPGLQMDCGLFQLEKFEELTSAKDAPNPDVQIQDTDLASIIYTQDYRYAEGGHALT